MHYILARILTPVIIETIGDYTIKYDDLYNHSVWFEEHCLFENTTLDDSKEFCKTRLNLIGKIVFVYNTYFIYIKGETYSKHIDEESWHRRYHFPWIGFYPVPQRIGPGTKLYENLINDFVVAEKNRRVTSVYKSYFTQRERERYNRI